MVNILLSMKKAAIYLAVLMLALFPISLIESSVRTYAADAGREEISATEPDEEEAAAEAAKAAAMAQAMAQEAKKTPDLPAIDQLEIPEFKDAKTLAQNNLIAKREDMELEWQAFKQKERELEEAKRAEEEAAARERARREAEEEEDREESRSSSASYSREPGPAGTGSYSEGTDLGKFKLTAYCPCYECSEGWGHMTSSGHTARERHTIATDPRVIPEGTRVIINGQVYVAEDTGGGVKGNHIDIFFEDHQTTDDFGVRYAEVFLAE